MNTLKKWAALGGAVSLAVCWPLAVGQIGQSIIEDGIAKLDSQSLKAEIISYERGYLSSVVTTRYTIIDPVIAEQFEADGLPVEFEMRSDLTHGLTSLDAQSLLLGIETLPLTISSTTQLNGNTDFTIAMDSWNVQSEVEGVSVSTAPMSVSGRATVLGDLNFEFDVPSIQVDFESGEELHLSNLKGTGQGKQQSGYWLGKQDIQVGELQLSDVDAQPIFGLYQSRYLGNTQLDAKGERLESQLSFKTNKLLMSDGNEAQNLNIDFSLKNLDRQAFNQVMAIYQNSPVLTEEDLGKILPHIDTLFDKGFAIAIDNLSMTLGEGKFENQWHLQIPQGTDKITQDPMKIITAMQGDVHTYFSNELVTQYPFIQEGVDELLVMELLEQIEGGYQLKADIKEGKLVFENGQAFPLFSLLMPAMMQ
ncbi:hypothetical protein BOO92_16830 [Vibrio navarrensis]|uniref:DUF945 family protein n=1 Tax=Vibrio TaxID=662 RepID=UPI0005EEBCFB|nr:MULTISPECIES: DUF945 family protein [Vibrio]KJR21588.1 hypothetical protein UF06_19675 [Vibrio sp. S234-5]MBE3653416.1 hypothetical protein [Vibrio navarrensis]MBE3658345.1 hypothetical protein [Vibrio navarrensis]MBE4603121.1 hypothetical protein [Vibrio navarrensis]